MTITIFGSTGKTGIKVVQTALENGHNVRAFVRTPSKLGLLQDKVTIIQGSLENVEKINEAIKGSDCVISVLGHGSKTPADMQTQAIKKIISAMNAQGIKRLIALTGAGVAAEGDKPVLINNIMSALLKLVAGGMYSDGVNYVNEIKNSDLNWTVLRAPVLTQGGVSNKVALGMVGDANFKFSVSRMDIAQKMIEIIADTTTFKKLPFISTTK